MIKKKGTWTKWGEAQSSTRVLPGFTVYSTAGHGGAKISKTRNSKIPAIFRNKDGWYEEDCELNIPMYFFYEEMKEFHSKIEKKEDKWLSNEWFDKFPKERLKNSIENYFKLEYWYHFDKGKLSKEELEKLEAREREVNLFEDIKSGSIVTFVEAIKFTNGMSCKVFKYRSGINFTIFSPDNPELNGAVCKISSWLRYKIESVKNEGGTGMGKLVIDSKTAKFKLGQVVVTAGVNNDLSESEAFSLFVYESLKKHAKGDWGDLTEEDRNTNEEALKDGSRLFSAYEYNKDVKIWIITEWDRSVTTILFPDEY